MLKHNLVIIIMYKTIIDVDICSAEELFAPTDRAFESGIKVHLSCKEIVR